MSQKNKFQVIRMESADFQSTVQIEKNLIWNRKIDINNEKVSWLKTREIYLDKEKPFSIFFKQNFEDESYVEVDIRKKQAGRPSAKAFTDLLPMWLDSKAKFGYHHGDGVRARADTIHVTPE